MENKVTKLTNAEFRRSPVQHGSSCVPLSNSVTLALSPAPSFGLPFNEWPLCIAHRSLKSAVVRRNERKKVIESGKHSERQHSNTESTPPSCAHAGRLLVI